MADSSLAHRLGQAAFHPESRRRQEGLSAFATCRWQCPPGQQKKASLVREAFSVIPVVVRVALDRQTVSQAAVADGSGRNHRGKSPPRFAPRISAWDCSPLLSCAPVRLSGQDVQICHQVRLCGPIRVSKRPSATVHLHIVNIFGPLLVGKRFPPLFPFQPLDFGPGIAQVPLQGCNFSVQRACAVLPLAEGLP